MPFQWSSHGTLSVSKLITGLRRKPKIDATNSKYSGTLSGDQFPVLDSSIYFRKQLAKTLATSDENWPTKIYESTGKEVTSKIGFSMR